MITETREGESAVSEAVSYESSVYQLSQSLTIPDEKLEESSNESGKDYEHNILSWMDLVEFDQEDASPKQIEFHYASGRTVKVDLATAKLPKDPDQEVTSDDMLFALALAEAKLSVVGELMEDVYPALYWQSKEYIQDLHKQRDLLLNSGTKKTQARISVSGLNKNSVRSALLLTAIIVAACTGAKDVNQGRVVTTTPDNRPTVTLSSTATEEATATASATATEAPTKTPSPTATEAPTLEPTKTAAELSSIKVLEQYGLDASAYTISEKDGVVTVTDKDGKEVMVDGRFDLHFAVDSLVKDPKPTSIKPDKRTDIINLPTREAVLSVCVPLLARARSEYKQKTGEDLYVDGPNLSMMPLLIDPDVLAYGVIGGQSTGGGMDGTYLSYENKTKQVITIPVMNATSGKIVDFYK